MSTAGPSPSRGSRCAHGSKPSLPLSTSLKYLSSSSGVGSALDSVVRFVAEEMCLLVTRHIVRVGRPIRRETPIVISACVEVNIQNFPSRALVATFSPTTDYNARALNHLLQAYFLANILAASISFPSRVPRSYLAAPKGSNTQRVDYCRATRSGAGSPSTCPTPWCSQRYQTAWYDCPDGGYRW